MWLREFIFLIELSPTAHKWFYDCIEHRNKATETAGIRLGVRTTGCSGLAYTVEFENGGDNAILDVLDSAYPVYDAHNRLVVVYISERYLPYLAGMTVDYVTENLISGLKFSNPNERSACGCGESFTV